MLKLRDELELKVNVLSLPVDICVQQALQGNSALQGALNVALKVLQDIEDFEANLQQQEIDLVSSCNKIRLTHLLAMHTPTLSMPSFHDTQGIVSKTTAPPQHHKLQSSHAHRTNTCDTHTQHVPKYASPHHHKLKQVHALAKTGRKLLSE